jgi:hypothetical protein
MSTSAVFASNAACLEEAQLRSGDIAAWSESATEASSGRLQRTFSLPRSEYVGTDDITLSPRSAWLASAFRRLASVGRLQANWDSYEAEAPNEQAIQLARQVIESLDALHFQPTSIDASAEAGVCISFLKENRYGDIECFNSGAVLAVVSTPSAAPVVWEVMPDEKGFRNAATAIKSFLSR